MTPAPTDLPNRRAVWEALSEMFLDTDVSAMREWRVGVLASSPYSLAELETILVDEVFPICKYNLIAAAGAWNGIDQAWLEEQILRRLRSPLRVLRLISLTRLLAPRMEEWRATRLAVEAARGGQRAQA